MKQLALFLSLVAFSTTAFGAGYLNEHELKLVREVRVHMYDQVADGCLPNPKALKVGAELILRRAGIAVADDIAPYVLLLHPLGFEQASGICAFRFDVELYRYTEVPEGHRALVSAFRDQFLGTHLTKSEMQNALRTLVTEMVSELANEIQKARQ